MISAGPGASRTRSPLRQTSTCGTPALARKLGMFGEMQRFAMRRNKDFRPHPIDHVEQFGAARMAGYVNQVGRDR